MPEDYSIKSREKAELIKIEIVAPSSFIKGKTLQEQIEGKDGFYVQANLEGVLPATAANYEVFFIATKPCRVTEVHEVHRVLGTNAGAVSLDIEKLTGTQALGAGVNVTVAPFNLKGTINTVISKKTIALQNTDLKVGDRLALKDTGILTAVAGLTVTLYLKPLGKGDYI